MLLFVKVQYHSIILWNHQFTFYKCITSLKMELIYLFSNIKQYSVCVCVCVCGVCVCVCVYTYI